MSKKRSVFKIIIKWIFILVVCIALVAGFIAYLFYNELQSELPDIKQLHTVEYQIPLRVYSNDGLLLAQFGKQKRKPITIDKVPQLLIHAFLAAEDGSFYSHPGVDYKGLLRAGSQLLLTGKKKQGGSTITMQVTRNFLLSREKTYRRKIKEIILALEIEKEYSKDKILELYVNKIYLGHRSYGIAAASSTYYGKELNQLSLAELAMIAGLPKAPSAYNPITNPKRAEQRRNYVLRRMYELSYINQSDLELALKAPLTASIHNNEFQSTAPYIAEMVRQEIVKKYADKAYSLGLRVYTTLDSSLQEIATNAVHKGLHNYDQRHGYRSLPHNNKQQLEPSEYVTTGDTQTAHVEVVDTKNNSAIAKLKNNNLIELTFKNIKWARKYKTENYLGNKLKSINDILKPNDVITVRQLPDKTWALAQVPEAEAAFVALDANKGSILALAGGFDFFRNKYNRVIQSKRQPGSGFKPIIYTTALENGYSPASLINDAPIVVDDPSEESEWRPQNYSKKFFGLTPLRTALRKSRNLISIRLLRELGIKKVTNTALRFGFNKDQLPNSLSLALGSGDATPLQMATAFSVFANGGYLVKPYFIDKIEDYNGKLLFQAEPKLACPTCAQGHAIKSDLAPKIISPQINFLMNSLLRDVVQRGTATRAKVLGRSDLAGKTGTTNDQRDTWFNGYSAGIVATAWLGFDTAKPLGRNETGGKAALPIWIDFMKTALQAKPVNELIPPEGIDKAYIDSETGMLAQENTRTGIWEYFLSDQVPTEYAQNEPEIDFQEEEFEEESLF